MRTASFAFLLGAGLFLLAVLPPSGRAFWFDEVFTANLVTFRTSPQKVLERVEEEDAHPPGFYLLAWAYAKATGLWGSAVEGVPEGLEARLRLLPIALGAIASGLVSLHGGMAAALALASSPAFLERAGEFRMYPLLGLFWTLAYLGVLRDRPFLAAWAGLGALYTHYLAPFLLLPLYGAMALKRGWRSLLALWPLLLYLPWLPVFLQQLRGGMAMAAARPGPVLALEPLYRLGGHEPLALLLLGVVLYGAWRERKGLGLLLLVPFLAPLLWWAGSLLVNTVSLRYVGAFLPPMALAVGVAARGLGPLARGGLLLVLATAYLGLVLSGEARPKPPNEGYHEKARLMEAIERRYPDPLVLGDERGRLISLRYYWRGEGTLRLVGPEDVSHPPLEKRALVLLRYPGWVAPEQIWMTRLLNELKDMGTLKLLNGEGGVLLYLWREEP
ncbi:hypothetical protein [Thermus thermophilus]|uniref:hypothetical protein n=1 Tax=Thermus thermophilus TaxID=274 RepID=UPI001FCD0F61|nr:hypothetical protein [Thermus thermophilus]